MIEGLKKENNINLFPSINEGFKILMKKQEHYYYKKDYFRTTFTILKLY